MTDTFENRIATIKAATEAMNRATTPAQKADIYSRVIKESMACEETGGTFRPELINPF